MTDYTQIAATCWRASGSCEADSPSVSSDLDVAGHIVIAAPRKQMALAAAAEKFRAIVRIGQSLGDDDERYVILAEEWLEIFGKEAE